MAKSPKDEEGKDGKEEKKEAKKRPAHDLVGNKDTKVYPFTETPPDFDFDKHASLKKRDFATDWQFFTHKTKDLQFRADAWKAKAEEAKKLGSGKEKAKAKKLLKIQAQMKELRAQLEAQNVDVDAILAEGAAESSGAA